MLLNNEQANMNHQAPYFCINKNGPYNLLGFLPLISDSYRYYAMKTNSPLDASIGNDLRNRNIWQDYKNTEITHVSPVFGGTNVDFQTPEEYQAKVEQEWAENGLPHRKSFSMEESKRRAILNNQKENPYILFFHGCDDGHCALRFQNEQAAKEYLTLVETFEDVIENNTMIWLN